MRMSIRTRAITLALALGILGAVVSALAAAPESRTGSSQRPVPQRAEDRLQRAVRHELLMLPYYGVFDNLEYRVVGYRVELYGQVVNPVLKSDAEHVVQRIEGVERVDNHIEVLPVSIFDDHIRLAEYRAIYRHAVMTKYAIQPVPPIHIIVNRGNVTLVGVVDSKMDRQIAYLQANSVPNVFSVTNKLRIGR